DGIIRSWNPGATKIYGYLPDEVIGQPIWMLAPDRKDEFLRIMDRLRRGEHVDHFQTKRRHKDGRLLDISLTISPIADASGTLVGASSIARDVTSRRRIEEQLERIAQLTIALSSQESEERILDVALGALED